MIKNKNNDVCKTNKVAKKVKKPPKCDIISFISRQMLYGNISILSIPRDEIENALRNFCSKNPSVDVTKFPIAGFINKNGKDQVVNAIITLAKKYCGKKGSNTAVFSDDGNKVLMFGPTAKEIISNLNVDEDKIEHLKTKIKVKATLKINKKLKCFGGQKISNYI